MRLIHRTTAFGGTSSTAQPLQLVFPSGISPKYANEPGGLARMHTCLDQYIENKASNSNGGLNSIQKGGCYFDGRYVGGYYVECNQHLKLPQISAPVPSGPKVPTPQIAKKPDPESFSGTAFFISSEGKALTNAHVVQGCRQISVNKDGHSSPAKLVASDERNDLALLEANVNPTQTAKWRFRVRQGEEIVVYGFPLTRVLASTGNVATGNITALAGIADDSRFFQISAPVQPGNSGGPLLDRGGAVIGIVVAKLNALRIAAATGDIPQNINFAIKGSIVAGFLDAQRVSYADSSSSSASALSTPDIAERAKLFTVHVTCLR
jgi:S1-C subfamily serine protease